MPTRTTPSTLDSDKIETAARALLDEKVAAVRTLVETRQKREDARAAMSSAERADAAAYTAAVRAGWTTDELKSVGLDAPTKRTPGRPRATTRPSPTSTSMSTFAFTFTGVVSTLDIAAHLFLRRAVRLLAGDLLDAGHHLVRRLFRGPLFVDDAAHRLGPDVFIVER